MGITSAHYIFWLSLKLCNILELNSTKYGSVDIVMLILACISVQVYCSSDIACKWHIAGTVLLSYIKLIIYS